MSESISIIIPLFNPKEEVFLTVGSVLGQESAISEVIIVDDGSLQSPRSMIEQYLVDPRVKFIEQRNSGVPAARNRGLAAVSGTWVAVLDQDDLWHPSRARMLADFIRSNPTVEAIATTSTKFGDTADREKIKSIGEWVDQFVINETMAGVFSDIENKCKTRSPFVAQRIKFEALLKGNCFLSGATLVRRETLIAAGGFPIAAPMADDYLAWIGVARLTDWFMIDCPTFFYRVCPNSTGHTRDMTIPELAGLVFNWFGREETWRSKEARQSAFVGYLQWTIPRSLQSAVSQGDRERFHIALHLAMALSPNWKGRCSVRWQACKAQLKRIVHRL